MTHHFHPSAVHEFEEAVHFYAARGHNLGQRFASEVRAGIQKILANPNRWRETKENLHLCPVRVFPYRILYLIEGDSILIVAVMHEKRRPGYWLNRI